MLNDVHLEDERILVTGGNGVLGVALQKELMRRKISGYRAPERAVCNLLDFDAVVKYFDEFRPTVVFHLAGWVAGIGGHMSFAGQSYYENIQINTNVIEASRGAGAKKVVAASPTAVYSDLVQLPMREEDIWNGPPHSSEASYGHAKRAMLAQLQANEIQYGTRFAYMICTNLYGPNDRFDEKYGHVIPSLVRRFCEAARSGEKVVKVWGDGSPTRDFLFAQDAASAFLAAAERGSGTYNTASGTSVSIRQIVDIIQSASHFCGDVVWDTSKPNGQLVRSYDIRRINDLNWKPSVDLEEGIKKTVSWFQENRKRVRLLRDSANPELGLPQSLGPA